MLEQSQLENTVLGFFSSKICSNLANCFCCPKQLYKAKMTSLAVFTGLSSGKLALSSLSFFLLLQLFTFFSRGFFSYHCPLCITFTVMNFLTWSIIWLWCSFSRQMKGDWENTALLSQLLAVCKPKKAQVPNTNLVCFTVITTRDCTLLWELPSVEYGDAIWMT